MPKITQDGGPSYAGHVDVSSADTAAPEWTPAAPAAPAADPAEPVEPPAAQRPTPRKRTRNTQQEPPQ